MVHFQKIVAGEVFHIAGGEGHQLADLAWPALDEEHGKAEIPHQPHGRDTGRRATAADNEICAFTT